MNVQPTGPGPGPRVDPKSARESSATTPAAERAAGAPASAPDRDRVHLSEDVRALQAADPSHASHLSPDRLRQVLERISEGFYDRADVRDEVLRRLLDAAG